MYVYISNACLIVMNCVALLRLATDDNTARGMSPDFVAERMVLAVQQDESEVVVAPIDHRFAIVLRTLAPSFYFKIMAKMAKKHSS